MNETCKLCQISNRLKSVRDKKYSKEISQYSIFDSPNFYIAPSLGGIVEGWLMVIPKKHFLCIGDLNSSLFHELNRVIDFTTRLLSKNYSPPVIFEHGPSSPNKPIGCGVDHAHLHILPIECDIRTGIAKIFSPKLKWVHINGIQDSRKYFDAGLPYLYVEQPIGSSYITTNPEFPSQLIRQVIARYMGRPHEYDWRSFPHIENMRATIIKVLNRSSLSYMY